MAPALGSGRSESISGIAHSPLPRSGGGGRGFGWLTPSTLARFAGEGVSASVRAVIACQSCLVSPRGSFSTRHSASSIIVARSRHRKPASAGATCAQARRCGQMRPGLRHRRGQLVRRRAAVGGVGQVDRVEREGHVHRVRRLQPAAVHRRLPFERIHVDRRAALRRLALRRRSASGCGSWSRSAWRSAVRPGSCPDTAADRSSITRSVCVAGDRRDALAHLLLRSACGARPCRRARGSSPSRPSCRRSAAGCRRRSRAPRVRTDAAARSSPSTTGPNG